ncbi:MAG: CRISPR-associated protein Cas2 [Patescibacteria group bacterium]|nr:CRISPR-associated protein Cas2 [Patescibacteria group bacterium]MDD4610711.1 CRISPR-associated protein Cas2 [Patescibacteria group bacterium]
MKKFLISYDLNNHEDISVYNEVIAYIASYYEHAKALYSQWVIKTAKSAEAIRDELKKIVDNNDVVLVVEVSNSWASYNLPKAAVDLLKS